MKISDRVSRLEAGATRDGASSFAHLNDEELMARVEAIGADLLDRWRSGELERGLRLALQSYLRLPSVRAGAAGWAPSGAK